MHIQASNLLSKEKYARKRIHNGCVVQTENSVTRDNCSASLGKSRDADHDGIFNPHLTAIRDSSILCFSVLFNAVKTDCTIWGKFLLFNLAR